MIRHIWSILCRKSTIDSDSNNISLIDIFEQFDVNYEVKDQKKFTGVFNIPIEYEVVSLWQRENSTKVLHGEVLYEIYSPDNIKQKEILQKIEILEKYRRYRTRLRINGLVVNLSGIYIFKVKLKKEPQTAFKIVAELPLEVNIREKIKADK